MVPAPYTFALRRRFGYDAEAGRGVRAGKALSAECWSGTAYDRTSLSRLLRTNSIPALRPLAPSETPHLSTPDGRATPTTRILRLRYPHNRATPTGHKDTNRPTLGAVQTQDAVGTCRAAGSVPQGTRRKSAPGRPAGSAILLGMRKRAARRCGDRLQSHRRHDPAFRMT